jgi:hypothetical protein
MGKVWNYSHPVICTWILGCHVEILLLQVESLEGEPPPPLQGWDWVWYYGGDICTWILGCHAEILLL